MVLLCQRLTEITTDEILVPQFCAEGCTHLDVSAMIGRTFCTEPVEIATEVHAIDVSAVIVVFHQIRLASITLIAVFVLVPIDGRHQSEFAEMGLGLDGRIKLCGVLILVVGLPFGRCIGGA